MPKIGNINEEQFPDSVVVGEGAVAYVIPAGFNGIVEATQGTVPFSINGQPLITSDVIDTSFSFSSNVVQGGGQTFYTNNLGAPLLSTGSMYIDLSVGGRGMRCSVSVYVGSTLVGSYGYAYRDLFSQFPNPTVSWSNVELSPLGTIRVEYGSFDLIIGTIPISSSGTLQTIPLSTSTFGTKVLSGDVIVGGRYAIGLYAI